MSERDRKVAEATFDKKQKREAEINEVLKQEDARRDATMKNMQRLRALRIERDAKKKNQPVSRFSLDTWAVFLAFGLSLLIWAGIIKHVPW